MVHRLLASSSKFNALWWWETAFPFPMPGETPSDPTPRQDAAKAMVDWLLTEWPDFESIDPMDAMAINEEVVLLDRTFLSTTYDSMMPIHAYGHWQAEQDHAPAIRDLYRFMQVIQHQRVARGELRRPWVFKTPHYVMGALGGLLKVWPDEADHDAPRCGASVAQLLQHVRLALGQFFVHIQKGTAGRALVAAVQGGA
jgi:hypothetical protein